MPCAAHPLVAHEAVAHLIVEMPGRIELKLPRHALGRKHHEAHRFRGQHLGRVAFEFLDRVLLVVVLAGHRFEIGGAIGEPLVAAGFTWRRELGSREAGAGATVRIASS